MSSDIKHRSNRTIAQGALTNSKHPDRFVASAPTHVKYGNGCHLYDMNDVKWLDMISGLGTNHFGYGNPKIQKELIRYSFHGNCHSLPTYHEVEASEKLKELFPFVEKVKWVNDGSSACTAAVSIARSYTNRHVVLTEGYHGWHPEQISHVAWKPDGCAYRLYKLEQDLANVDENIAAIIIEPVQLDDSDERIEFLKKLRTVCTEKGIVLIYDEVITGLRYPKFGVSNSFGILPDIILLGKAIGNGQKIAVVGGHSSLMDGDYFCSGTYHGHIPSLIAAKTCMNLAKYDSSFNLKRLNEDSLDFFEKLNAMAKGIFKIEGWGCRGLFKGNFLLFQQEMIKAKILFGPSIFINFDSVKHLNDVLGWCQMAIDNIRGGGCRLKGSKPTGAFSRKARND